MGFATALTAYARIATTGAVDIYIRNHSPSTATISGGEWLITVI